MVASLFPLLVSVDILMLLDLFKCSFKTELKSPKVIAITAIVVYLAALKTWEKRVSMDFVWVWHTSVSF